MTRHVFMLSALLVLLIQFTPLYAEERVTRDDVFAKMKRQYSENPSAFGHEWSVTDQLLHKYRFRAEGALDDSARIFIESIAENVSYAPRIRRAAIGCLVLFGAVLEHNRLLSLQKDSIVDVAASGALVELGYWLEGNPILIEKEAWNLLATGPELFVIPVLAAAAKGQTPTILGRFEAADMLTNLGHEDVASSTARAILREYLIDGAFVADTMDLSRAVYRSCETLAKEPVHADIELYEAALVFPFDGVRFWPCKALGSLARKGFGDAEVSLEIAAELNPYSDVVSLAREQLVELKSARGESK